MPRSAEGALRERVLDAVYAEVAERGLGQLTVEAVAVRAGSSRATVYRWFPGGRDELVDTAIRREVDRFLAALLAEAPPSDDVVGHVVGLVIGARRLLGEHTVLQRLLLEEADAILPSLATIQPAVQDALARHLAHLLGGADAGERADHAARMLLSYVGSAGGADLSDPAVVADVVRRRILSVS